MVNIWENKKTVIQQMLSVGILMVTLSLALIVKIGILEKMGFHIMGKTALKNSVTIVMSAGAKPWHH